MSIDFEITDNGPLLHTLKSKTEKQGVQIYQDVHILSNREKTKKLTIENFIPLYYNRISNEKIPQNKAPK